MWQIWHSPAKRRLHRRAEACRTVVPINFTNINNLELTFGNYRYKLIIEGTNGLFVQRSDDSVSKFLEF